VSLGTFAWLWIFDSIYSVHHWTLRAGWGSPGWADLAGQPRPGHVGHQHQVQSVAQRCLWHCDPLGVLSSIPPGHSRRRRQSTRRPLRQLFQIPLPLNSCRIQLVAAAVWVRVARSRLIGHLRPHAKEPYDSTHVSGPALRSSSESNWRRSGGRGRHRRCFFFLLFVSWGSCFRACCGAASCCASPAARGV